MEIVSRFFRRPEQSFFLFGPRGTGKSLWARETYQDALWVDLLDPETYRLYTGRPERLREVIEVRLSSTKSRRSQNSWP